MQAFNSVSAEDNLTSKQLLKDARNDGRELTTVVSLLTLVFLPGSFISVSQNDPLTKSIILS